MGLMFVQMCLCMCSMSGISCPDALQRSKDSGGMCSKSQGISSSDCALFSKIYARYTDSCWSKCLSTPRHRYIQAAGVRFTLEGGIYFTARRNGLIFRMFGCLVLCFEIGLRLKWLAEAYARVLCKQWHILELIINPNKEFNLNAYVFQPLRCECSDMLIPFASGNCSFPRLSWNMKGERNLSLF